MRIYLHTIGCRLNQAEIERMARQLTMDGHTLAGDAAGADTIILNTCAVTAEAVRDARRLTHRFHRANEAAEIVLDVTYQAREAAWLALRASGVKLAEAPSPRIKPVAQVAASMAHSAAIHVSIQGAPGLAEHRRAKLLSQAWLDRLDDFERRLTLFAMNNLSLIHVFIDVDLRMAFRTSC